MHVAATPTTTVPRPFCRLWPFLKHGNPEKSCSGSIQYIHFPLLSLEAFLNGHGGSLRLSHIYRDGPVSHEMGGFPIVKSIPAGYISI